MTSSSNLALSIQVNRCMPRRNVPSRLKLTTCRMRGKGEVEESRSDYAAPILVVRKPEGGLQVCVDYRQLNADKTACLTWYGLFEYIATPFGLCNAPGIFQAYINKILRQYLDEFCSADLGDILVYSEMLEQHKEHVRKVVQTLKDAGSVPRH